MISSIDINHFKSIESAKLDLEQVTVLVGLNSAGKSNLVDVLRFIKDSLRYGLDRAVSDRHGIDSIRQWSPRKPYQIWINMEVESEKGSGWYSLVLASAQGQYKIKREEAQWNYVDEIGLIFLDDNANEDGRREFEEVENLQVSCTFSRDENGALDLSVEPKGTMTGVPLNWIPDEVEDGDDLFLGSRAAMEYSGLDNLLSSFEAYSIFPNTLRQPQEPTNEVRLLPHGQNICSVFKQMRKRKQGLEAVAEITASMKRIMPNLERISIHSVGGYLVPQFQVREASGQTHIFNVSQISDGTLRVLGILTALYQTPRPDIIAIEEPELTVNPGVLPVIVDAIREASTTSQVIITTHSPELLDYFSPDEIRSVEHIDGVTTVARIRKAQANAVKEKLFSLGELLVTEGLSG